MNRFKNRSSVLTGMLMSVIILSACQQTPVEVGSPEVLSPVSGSAGGGTAVNQPTTLERCDKPIGTVALSEDHHSAHYKHAKRYGLVSSTDTLRLFVQQSNCFVMVERGRVLENTQFERQLQRSGELRQDSNFGKGQLVAADFTLSPRLIFQNQNVSGTTGGLIGLIGTVVGGASGKVKYKESQAMLIMVDNRTGVQVLASEGRARGSDKEIFIGAIGTPLVGGFIESHAKTTQDKVIVGSYLDAYNNLVTAAKSYVAQESAGPKGHGTGSSFLIN